VVSTGVRASDDVARIDVSDLRGGDELGVLAGGLGDLLQRVNEDVRREHIRAAQDKDLWHAVGHEIMSPLQSLMALHGAEDDPSHRYIARMQQAVRVLYGHASPTEAFEASTLQLQPLDLRDFLANVAANAAFIGIDNVVFESTSETVLVRADEFPLEDVITHVLRNAQRHRDPGTAIRLSLSTSDEQARIVVHNQGPPIADALIDQVFEYGVSDQPGDPKDGRRGQGLFVARTYMAKMGGTIDVANIEGGVAFGLVLPRLAPKR
jgi:signal transduction histidine kinase